MEFSSYINKFLHPHSNPSSISHAAQVLKDFGLNFKYDKSSTLVLDPPLDQLLSYHRSDPLAVDSHHRYPAAKKNYLSVEDRCPAVEGFTLFPNEESKLAMLTEARKLQIHQRKVPFFNHLLLFLSYSPLFYSVFNIFCL